ncbi:hypothetical protein PVAP13_6KG332100 [Panicum virgatum]|uniref:Uncharacterized protein n=1 Tax=Panicum virgatum TaxID=38727 RepID=A0A8T0RF45_PANVG|nr:hypothetical protein PVAP13_6KG332100 [Panicum virgatum]
MVYEKCHSSNFFWGGGQIIVIFSQAREHDEPPERLEPELFFLLLLGIQCASCDHVHARAVQDQQHHKCNHAAQETATVEANSKLSGGTSE